MKSRNDFRVLFLVSNGHYHPNEAPQLYFPLGPARLAAKLRKAGYLTHILDTQAEGLLQVVSRKKTRRLGSFVGHEPELVINRAMGKGFDTVEVGLPDGQMLERIKTVLPDLIIATHTFSMQTKPLLRQINYIKSKVDTPILIGGVAASMYPDSFGEHRKSVYRGKFDDYITELVDAHRTGIGIEQLEKYKVQFAELKHRKGVIEVEPLIPELFPIFQLPVNVYEDVEATLEKELQEGGANKFQRKYPFVIKEGGEFYLRGPIYGILWFGRQAKDILGGLMAQILTREGCIFTCEGCHIAVETRMGNPLGVLVREINAVVEELKTLRNLGYKKIILGDDQALLPKPYIINLAKEVMPLELEFHLPNAVLVNAVAKMGLEDLGTLMLGGFRSFSLAVESACQEVVKEYWDNKIPSVIQTTLQACQKLQDANKKVGLPIRVEAYFVIGCAGITRKRETLGQMYDSICFGRYLIEKGLVDYVVYSLYIPAPGTISYENLNRWGMILDPYAMTFGLYAIDGEGEYSPHSIEALRLAGWLFANRKETVESRSCFNLEPEVDSDPHAHIDRGYRNYHLGMLGRHYSNFLIKMEEVSRQGGNETQTDKLNII